MGLLCGSIWRPLYQDMPCTKCSTNPRSIDVRTLYSLACAPAQPDTQGWCNPNAQLTYCILNDMAVTQEWSRGVGAGGRMGGPGAVGCWSGVERFSHLSVGLPLSSGSLQPNQNSLYTTGYRVSCTCKCLGCIRAMEGHEGSGRIRLTLFQSRLLNVSCHTGLSRKQEEVSGFIMQFICWFKHLL